MNTRFFTAMTVAAILIIFVFTGQNVLTETTESLAEQTDEVCEILSDDTRQEEGMRLLRSLIEEFDRRSHFLGVFVNDTRIHEIQRAMNRARQLAETGDSSPALEALSDVSKTLKEMAETHRPTWDNIL